MKLLSPRGILLTALLLSTSLIASAQSMSSKIQEQGRSKYIKITGLLAKQSDGFLHLQAELTNNSRKDQQAFYRVVWLDESGFQVWNDEPWKPVLLHGDQKQNIEIVSPTPKAKDFRIQFNGEQNKAKKPT